MNNLTTGQIAASVLTAFIIVTAGSIGVAAIATGGELNTKGLVASFCLGLVSASKDFRSLMKLPPVKDTDSNPPFIPGK